MLKAEKREDIIKIFTIHDSKLHLIMATTAFGMGIDYPDNGRIIEWGLPSNTEDYAQETGRAGQRLYCLDGIGSMHQPQ